MKSPFLSVAYRWLFIFFISVITIQVHADNRVAPSAAEAQAPESSTRLFSNEKQESETVGNQKILNDPYTGIVVNQTITVAGQDFFQYFIAAWRDKEMVDKFEISISERPSARFGSQIWINYGQRRIFQTFLPAARAAIKPISLAAADAVYEGIVQADVQRLLFRDPDLGPDEF
jgi:curli production assembly/transport component CsgE